MASKLWEGPHDDEDEASTKRVVALFSRGSVSTNQRTPEVYTLQYHAIRICGEGFDFDVRPRWLL